MRGEPTIVKQLLQKAKDSALLAIEYYNKPAVSFKTEGFIVMMCIAWTAFFHAYFLKNKVKPWYRKKDKGKKPRFDSITEKLPNSKEIKDKRWWDLKQCLSEFYKDNQNDPVLMNIQFLSGLRNLIVHRNLPELDASMFAECQASVLNFNEYLGKYFGYKQKIDVFLSFSIQLFKDPKNFLEASKKELKNKNATEIVEYIKAFRSALSTDILESPQYSFKAVLIQVKNHASRDALALKFIHEKELTEEQKKDLQNMGIVLIKEKEVIKDVIPNNFSLTCRELREKIKKEIPGMSYKYSEKIRKYFKYKYKDKYVYERVHNPKSKKTSSTYFYDPQILDEFRRFSNSDNQIQIESLVDQIITAKKANPQADTSHWEREIDQLVYKPYELTEEEKRIIEKGERK